MFMVNNVVYASLCDLYHRMAKDIPETVSRIGYVHEMLNATFSSSHPYHINYRPGMNRRLGIVEGLQVISGYFDERLLKQVAPRLRYPYTIHQAYGIKIAQQLPKLIEQLAGNPNTRRAILHIGKSEDGFETEKPCIQSLQFLIREDRLLLTGFARSWDVISGLPHDLIVMQMVQQMIANLLMVTPGDLTVFATSFHLYQSVWNSTRKNWQPKLIECEAPWPPVLVMPYMETLNEYREWSIDQLNSIDNWNPLPEGINV